MEAPRSLQLSASAPELGHVLPRCGALSRPGTGFEVALPQASLSGLSWRPSSRAFGTVVKVRATGTPLVVTESNLAVPGSRSGIHGTPQDISLLGGLSPPIGFQNYKAEDDLDSLGTFRSPGRSPALPRIMSSPCSLAGSTSMRLGLDLRSNEDFAASMEKCVGLIHDLQKGAAHWDPGGLRSSSRTGPDSPKNGPGSPKSRGLGEEEEGDSLQERLEAYKMGRRIEAELPPLAPYSSGIPRRRVKGENDIIARNQHGDSLSNFRPAKRRQTIAEQASIRHARRTLAGVQRDDLLVRASVALSEVLERKKEQGKQALQNQKKNDSKPGKKEAMERWLSALTAIAFVERLQQERVFKTMSFADKMKLSDSAKNKFKRGGTMVLEAVQMGANTQDPLFQQRLLMFQCMIKTRTLRRDNRNAASVLFRSMSSWKRAGRCFVSLRRFANQVKKLQRFWRTSAKRLREARDKVAARWMRIERKELVQELNKADPINPKDRRKSSAGPKLSLEEKIQLALLPDEVRWRFISSELRTRRYMLLPAIQVWERDAEEWRREMEEWRALREAHRTVESTGHLDQGGFRWPPARPSYMPAHFGPLSLQGDAEILDMYKRARRNPNGWSKIPTAGGGLEPRKAEGPKEDKDRCPEPTEEDLRLFGINPNDLPGIAAGGKPKADPENPEPGVAPV